MKDCCIIIPIYKEKLDNIEELFLINNINKLSNYDIYVICPSELNTQYYNNISNNYIIITFDNLYFKSTETYSKLLTSSFFYEQFNDYKYMLICQTDAFIFGDKLEYLINLDYDYYGAPWPHRKDKIGNGGLSLRKISKFMEITNTKNYIDFCKKITWDNGEDLFFSMQNNVNVCPLEIAILFSLENDPQRYINMGANPMGCHLPWCNKNKFINFYKNYKELKNILN